MKQRDMLLICLILISSVVNAQDDIYKDLPFEMSKVVIPSFPSTTVSVVDYGAIGNGSTLNTEAFNRAIDDLAKRGGGRVIIPRGIWLTGPIVLKSNINLHTEAGALIIFSTNMDDYPLVEVSFEGLNTMRCASPIIGRDLVNVAITGKGVFDGSGDAWRPVKKSKLTSDQWKKLVASGGVLNDAENTWYPSEKSRKGATETKSFNVPDFKSKKEFEAVKDFLRPVMVSLVKCKSILLDGPTFQNSPAWCIHPLMSQELTVRNVTVRNPWYSQNGDGIDVESCKNVVIEHCSFDVGDDAICIKSGKDKEGRLRAMPTENVIVNDCIVYHGHGGFVVGSEMSSGVRNLKVMNCTFIGTDVGLRFKSTRGRGGVVEKIYISNINMIDIPAEAILFDLFYSGNSPIPTAEENTQDKKKDAVKIVPVTEETPSFKDIYIENVQCRGAGRAIFMQGLVEMNLKNIQITNVDLTAKKGIEVVESDGVLLQNVSVKTESGPSIALRNAKNINVRDLKVSSENNVVVTGSTSENIQLPKSVVVKVSDEVNKKAVSVR